MEDHALSGETLDPSRSLTGGGLDHVRSCILYQNEAKTSSLMDIPVSITLAAGHSNSLHMPWLLSCEPLQEPYGSTEPKSEAARARVEARTKPSPNDAIYRTLICDGLAEIRRVHRGAWCAPRHISPYLSVQGSRKRNARPAGEQDSATMEPSLASPPSKAFDSPITLSLPPETNTFSSSASMSHRPVHNLCSIPISLTLRSTCYDSRSSFSPAPAPLSTYYIPPNSTILLSTLSIQTTSPQNLHSIFLPSLPHPTPTAAPGQFDLVVLDPPWPNRSAHRSRTYSTAHRMQDPLFGLKDSLGAHLSPAGVVACWITHRAGAREAALEAFDAWDVQLVEEWVWAKVTVSGELLGPIDGIWRRPWEVLLVGKKSEEGGAKDAGRARERQVVKRRLLAAVPDLHSRKPSLKEPLADWVPQHGEARVLEIFARNVTAGWWAWGDEALRFNWEGHWSH